MKALLKTLTRRRVFSRALTYLPAISLSAGYAIFSFDRRIPWHWFNTGHKGAIRADRNYSSKFLVNVKSKVVHWANSELFLDGTSIQRSHFTELAASLTEVEPQLRGLLSDDAIFNPARTREVSKVIQNPDRESIEALRDVRLNRSQAGLAVVHAAVSALSWSGSALVGTSSAISLLVCAMKCARGISRRQLDPLAKVEILSGKDQSKSFKLLRDVFKELQQRVPEISKPKYLSSFREFEVYWELVNSEQGIKRFRMSLEKRQKVARNSFEKWEIL